MTRRTTRIAMAILGRLGYEVDHPEPQTAVVTRRTPSKGREPKRPEWIGRDKRIFNYLQQTQVPALLAMYRVNCVIDVGANQGQYAARLRAGGYQGRIVSFEPTPDAFQLLQSAAAQDANWYVRPVALGREDGTTIINAVPGTLSSILPPTEFGASRYPTLRGREQIEVELRRLDGIFDELIDGLDDPRPFLKLDTQGFDLDVFVGAGGRIEDFVGVQSEVALLEIYEGMPRMPEAIRAYEEAGFEIAAMYPVARHVPTARVVEFDCVLVRAAAAAGR